MVLWLYMAFFISRERGAEQLDGRPEPEQKAIFC